MTGGDERRDLAVAGVIGEPAAAPRRRTAMTRRLLLLLLLPAALLVACGDSADDDGSAGSGDPGVGEPVDPGGDAVDSATFEGTITAVTELEPVTEGCTPPEDLDPNGSVSSDDPPICTDLATAPLGTILVEVDPGVDEGEKIVFTILQDTELTDDGGEIGFDDLSAGTKVVITFDGQIAESYPGQATAHAVAVAPE